MLPDRPTVPATASTAVEETPLTRQHRSSGPGTGAYVNDPTRQKRRALGPLIKDEDKKALENGRTESLTGTVNRLIDEGQLTLPGNGPRRDLVREPVREIGELEAVRSLVVRFTYRNTNTTHR